MEPEHKKPTAEEQNQLLLAKITELNKKLKEQKDREFSKICIAGMIMGVVGVILGGLQ